MAAIGKFSIIRTSGSDRGSLVVLPDLKNISAGLSKSTCTQADIHVISYQLPVNSRHLGFPSYLNIGQSPQQLSFIAQPHKHWYDRWNFVAILYTS